MSKGISLHIGLNKVDPKHYGGPQTLAGCENDAKAMEKLAKAQGFTPLRLLSKNATSTAVMDAITKASSELAAGDAFFITYAGHGGQVPDTNGDEEDKWDETWCLYDRELVDDELAAAWSKFAAGVRIVMLSDSCHSGTVNRLANRPGTPSVGKKGKRYRLLPPDVNMRTYRHNKALYDGIQEKFRAGDKVKIKASVLLISGCQDNQLSQDGDKNGLFTETMLEVWDSGSFSGGYVSFHKEVVSFMPPDQTPNYSVIGKKNAAFEKQKPFTLEAP